MVIGYTSGVFDLLHRGHINYLNLCREKCDVLYVGVDTDHIVKMKKGSNRPLQHQALRRNQVEELGVANFVIFKEKTTIEILKELKPSILFVPNNKAISEGIKIYARASKMKLDIIPYTNGISTTLLLEMFYGS
tara:strand:+ start:1099 stop:1500 length:402 start_codon:yes stop_codon:yes gene_type:complete